MKRINKNNIAEYINFLHIKKKGIPADKVTIDFWQKVPEDKIQSELNNMINNWRNSSNEIQQWNKEFFKKKGRANTYIAIVITIFSIIIIASSIYLYKRNEKMEDYSPSLSSNNLETVQPNLNINNSSVSQPNPDYLEEIGDNIEEQKFELEKLKKEKEELEKINKKLKEENNKIKTSKKNVENTPSAFEYENDEKNKKVISTLLNAETNQNAYTIKNCFATNVKQYWDLKNISNDKLVKRYQETWKKIDDISYENISFSKISKNKYKVTGKFIFYSLTDKIYKSLNFTNIYIFNDNNKIVIAYSL